MTITDAKFEIGGSEAPPNQLYSATVPADTVGGAGGPDRLAIGAGPDVKLLPRR